VRALSGKIFVIEVKYSDTIGEVKLKIQNSRLFLVTSCLTMSRLLQPIQLT
jgi:hypothetical protein